MGILKGEKQKSKINSTQLEVKELIKNKIKIRFD